MRPPEREAIRPTANGGEGKARAGGLQPDREWRREKALEGAVAALTYAVERTAKDPKRVTY